MATTRWKLLLVDDEPSVLDALRRTHRRNYDLSTALGGAEGLAAIRDEGPFDVVISDYQMPEMNGATFLSKVAEAAPDTVRMMLTGNADLRSAIEAVNTGRVFRFLTKPCEPEVFVASVEAAAEQVRLRRAEKELLEGTLKGSIEVLSEILSLADPDAFGRANRVRGYVEQVVELLGLPDPWMVESAALLSQVGCVALPGDLLARAAAGQELTPEQSQAYERHPSIGAKLLARIPRLEEVARIVEHQGTPYDELSKNKGISVAVKRGCQVLAACLAFDELLTLGATKKDALRAMSERSGAYPPGLVKVVSRLEPVGADAVARDVLVAELREGMILAQSVRSRANTLIVTEGQRITASLLERLRNHHQLRGVQEPIRVLVTPVTDAGTEAA